ncbi:MAG: hypothetical protein AVDCRST_MAG85-4130, partial [uncultured Solirubrobacteraceae bacterium]
AATSPDRPPGPRCGDRRDGGLATKPGAGHTGEPTRRRSAFPIEKGAPMEVVIAGGHGKVALRLTRELV